MCCRYDDGGSIAIGYKFLYDENIRMVDSSRFWYNITDKDEFERKNIILWQKR